MIRSVLRWRHALGQRRLMHANPNTIKSIDDLTRQHFATYSRLDHINRVGLTVALREMNHSPALIIETGTSAWGTDSSRLFSSYVEVFGGEFYSVDIRSEPSNHLGDLGPSSHFAVQDSVQFLINFEVPENFTQVDFAYLDSWDLDFNSPSAAMEHCLKEWRALIPLLGPGSVVVIDDTPIESFLLSEDLAVSPESRSMVPGKGALVFSDVDFLQHFTVLYHHYNLVLKWVH